MKLTLSWLKDYLQTDYSLKEICTKLTDIGLEVELVTNQTENLQPFRVAEIVKTELHPQSQKLKICQVNIGNSQTLQIVCGAANARSGLKVAYAPIGSIIPANQMVIKKAKIAGVESHGMLCSAAELNLGQDSEGIIEISDHVAIGTKIADLYGLGESIIEINITPNRGDCLGIYGIARDLAAAGFGKLKTPEVKPVLGQFTSPIKVEISDDNCTHFIGRYIKNVCNTTSPKWLKERLENVGVKSISAIVDITNYIMLSLNQPIHAYDSDKLIGNIVVRKAKANEDFKSLKDQQYKLSGYELVVSDDQGVISLAGIIGGSKTAISESSQNIFLEAAFFRPEIISETGRKLDILSDARYRFERGVDFIGVKTALEKASSLIVEICGGQASELIEITSNINLPVVIDFDFNQINSVLGIRIPQEQVIKILEDLGFQLKQLDNSFYQIIVPSHRSDVTISENLIEEIIRIYGYNQINSTPLHRSINCSEQNNFTKNTNLVRQQLCKVGLNEIISWSFIDAKIAALFAKEKPELYIANPIASDMNYMRPSLLPGLIIATRKNQLRDLKNLSFFEIGTSFSGVAANQQRETLAILRSGKNKERSQFKDERDFDVLDIKKDLLECLDLIGFSSSSIQISDQFPSYYHPYRSAALKIGKNLIGYFGELNPLVSKKMDLTTRVNIGELFLDDLPARNNKKSATKKPFFISNFQAVHRDFAFILEQETKVGDLIKLVENVDKELIKEVKIFDIYQGDKIPSGKKSLAFGVNIQSPTKTLTTEEIDLISHEIVATITTKTGGSLRG